MVSWKTATPGRRVAPSNDTPVLTSRSFPGDGELVGLPPRAREDGIDKVGVVEVDLVGVDANDGAWIPLLPLLHGA